MKIVKNLFFTGLALLAITFAACKDEPAGTPPPSMDGFLNSLEDLDVSESTGQPGFTVSNAVLGGDAKGVVITLEATGNIFSVSGGKLNSFTIAGVPPGNFEQFETVKKILLGTADDAHAGTFDPGDTKFRIPSFYGQGEDGKGYLVYRYKEDTDGETYFFGSMIQYVYVDKDCTVTRDAASWTETDDERGAYTVKYKAIDLQLKEGWNLVQQNQNSTKTEDTITMKIADKDIPWYIRRTGN